FAAHLGLYVKLNRPRQNRFPIWDNIILLQANSEEEACGNAEARGHDDAGDCAGTFRWGGQPATWVFAGVRKLATCDNESKRPGDGTEIGYFEMELASTKEISQLVEGLPVAVRMHDRFPEEGTNVLLPNGALQGPV